MVGMKRVVLSSFSILALASSPVLIVLGCWAAHHHPFRQDRHLFEYMGQVILAGGRIYADCWDNKPPMLPWINAAVLHLSDDSTLAITVAAGLAAGLLAICVTIGAWMCFGRYVGSATALLAATVVSLRYYDGCTNGTELYAAAFESVAALMLVCAFRGRGIRAWSGWLVCGMAFGAAFATKQNALGGILATVVVFGLLGLFRPGQHARNIAIILTVVAGTAAVLGTIALVLARQSVLDQAVFAIFTFNLTFLQAGHSWWNFPETCTLGRSAGQIGPLVPVFWTALLAIPSTWVFARRSEPSDSDRFEPLNGAIVALMVLWLAAAAYSVLWGPCHLNRYWHACYVPLLWLCAQTLFFVGRCCFTGPASSRTMAACIAVTAAVLLYRPLVHRQYCDLLYTTYYILEDPERDRIERIVNAVKQRTEESDTIYVWGYEPGVYRFSHRFSPTRFAELDKLSFLSHRIQFMIDEITDTLTRTLPKLILVPKQPLLEKESDCGRPADISALRDLLQSRYDRVSCVEEYHIYQRRSTDSAPAATGTQPSP
jgi:hypothetical protein